MRICTSQDSAAFVLWLRFNALQEFPSTVSEGPEDAIMLSDIDDHKVGTSRNLLCNSFPSFDTSVAPIMVSVIAGHAQMLQQMHDYLLSIADTPKQCGVH